MTRRTFGRRNPVSDEQRAAKTAACWLFAGFAACIVMGLQTSSAGLAVLLVTCGFVSLAAAMAAAGEA